MADNPYDKVYDNLFTQDTTSDMAQRDPIMPAPTPIPVPAIPDPANDITAPISLPETSLRSSFMDGMQYKPDEAAKALPLAKQNQIPLDMTLRNLPDLQKQADFNNIDFKTLNRDYPKLAEFFSQPDNAAVAHDSVDSLKWLQDKGSALWYSGWGGVANVIGYGADVLKHVSIPGTDNSDVRKMLESVQETTDQAAWYANYRESQLPDTFGNQLAGMVGQMAPATAATMLDPLAGGLMWAGMFARPMQIAAKEHGAGEDMQTLVGAASALTSTLAVTPALKALTGKSPIIQEMISKVPDFVKQGWLQNIARSPWMQRALQAGGGAVAGAEMNVTQTILNNLIEHYTFNPDKKIIENIGKQAEMGGTAGALMHMLLSRIGSKGMPSPEIPPMPPKDMAENLKAQAKAIQENPLWKRSPETFHELQKKLWGDKTLYIPAEEGIKFFQGQDEKTQNDIAQRIPDLAQRAAEAQATGADIPVSYADYLAWIAPHDTNGTLASKAKMDAAHEPVDVASLYPELLKMIPKEEPHDEAAQALETKLVREAQQAGLAKHEAEAWAHMVRTAYGTIKGHSEEDAGPFAGLSVKPSNLVEGVSDKGLDFTIAQMKGRIRSRVAADKARADKTAEANAADIVGGKVTQKKEKAKPTPVMNYVAKLGGIKRGSEAAKELANAGITSDTHSKLFSEKPGALADLNNIDVANFNKDSKMVDRQLVAPTDDEHYIRHGWLHDQIVEEAHQRGHLSPEEAAQDEKNQYLDRFEAYVHSLGMEPDRATRAEIKAAVAKQRAAGETRYQNEFKSSGDTIDEGTEYLIQKAKDLGLNISEVSKSENRIGGRSNYLSVSSDYTHSSIRISDHSKNTNYRTESTWIIGTDKADIHQQVDKFLEKFSEGLAKEKALQDKADELLKNPDFVKDYAAFKKKDRNASQFKSDQLRAELAKKYDIEDALNKSAFVDRVEGIKKSAAGETRYQGEEQQGNRGSITFTPDGKSLIELFKNRDKSSILHETGHFFLKVLRNAKSEPVRALWEKTKGWWSENHSEVYKEAKRYNPYQVKQHDLGYFGVNLGDREIHAFDSKKAADEFADQKHAEAVTELDNRGGKDYVKKFIDGGMEAPDETDQMILTAMDEQFARGYEAYLMEGKAPSEELRPVFRRFTAWLSKIYGSITKLNVNLTPEIRDVFDRILASDEAIDATKRIEAFKPDPAIMEMMSKTQREAYLKQQQEREDSAREKTVRKALRDADKETKDWWKAEAEAKEKALREVYLRQPDYAAAQHLREGKLEDGTPVKLDRNAVEEKYGKDVAKAMDKKYFGTEGSDPDLIADSLGYNTGDDLVVALTKLDPLDRRVKDEVHTDMVKQHGDVFLNGDLEELAVRNMLSTEAAGLIEKEMKAVEDKTGPMPSGRDFKKAARDAVGTMSIRNATKPTRFLQAVIRMAKAGVKALAGKDYEGYADAKRKELFALHMFRETRDFQDKYEKANDYFKQVARRPKLRTKTTVDPEFRRMAWGVLANFMEARAPALKLADLQALIVQNITSEYETPVVIPPEAAAAWAKKSFKDMTVGEFNAVHDIVKGLMTYGHNKQSILIEGQRKDFAETMTKVLGIVGAVKNDRVDWSRNVFQKTLDKILAFELQTDTYLEIMDKGDKTGFMQSAIKRPLDLARAAEIDESKKVYDDLREIFTSSWTPKELREMTGLPGKFTQRRKILVNGRAFTHEERLAYLLNSGNEGNAESTDTGMGWKDAERQAMMATFSKKDYDFAQKIWDYVNSYWPRISALEEKRYGIAPEKIEARALQTPYGEYAGGYYPIKFDASLNKRVDDFDLEKEMKGYVGYASTATKRGYTKERVGPNSLDRMPVNLSFSTLTGHLQAVIHDLNMGEAIQQTAKILRDSRFKTPFVDRFGSDAYGAIDLWLKDIASGHIRDGNLFSQIDQWARRNAQVATMALNTTTIMSHPGRLMNSVEGLGGGAEGMKWIGVGFRKQFAAMRNPAEYRALLDAINKKSGMMKSRVDTMSREMADAQHHYSSDPMDTHKYRRALLLPIQLMQVHAVDISTWLGAYHQKLENSTEADPIAKEREAVFHADQIVRKYQGSGLMEDMSGLLRGTLSNNTRQSALVKTVTFAHSFFNNKFNRIYTATKLADFSTASGRYKYARAIITMSIMDALITDLLLQRLPGQTGEDDKKKVAEGWSWWMANRGLELFPLARETERMAKGQDTGTPAEEIAKAVAGAAAALHRDKEDKKELEAVISGVGMGTGLLPSVELNRFIDLMDRIREKQPVAYKDFVRSRRKSEK